MQDNESTTELYPYVNHFIIFMYLLYLYVLCDKMQILAIPALLMNIEMCLQTSLFAFCLYRSIV